MYTLTRLLLGVTLLCKVLTVTAQPDEEWSGSYGGTDWEEGQDIALAPNGGFVMVGNSGSTVSGDIVNPGYGSTDLLVVRIDADSTVLWERRLGGTDQDGASAVITDAQGRFLIAGYSQSDPSGVKTAARIGFRDVWVICLDASGTVIWQQTYGGIFGETPVGIIQKDNGNFIIASTTDSPSNGGTNRVAPLKGINSFWLFEIDPFGQFIQERVYGGDDIDTPWEIKKLQDGSLLYSGTSRSQASGDKSQPTNGASDMWLLHLDENGNVIRDFTFGGDGVENAFFTTQFSNGDGFVSGQSTSGVSGNKTTPGLGGLDLWCIRFNLTTGAIVWNQTFGGDQDDNAFTGRINVNDYIVLAGNTRSAVRGDSIDTIVGPDDGWMKYISPDGENIWDITRGGNGRENIRSIIRSEDGGWYLVGESNSNAYEWKNGASKGTDFNGIISNDIWYAKLKCDFTVDLGVRDTSLCMGEVILLRNHNSDQVLANTSYLWSDGSRDTVLSISPADDTQIVLQSVSPDACEAVDSVSIHVHPRPTIEDVIAENESCAGLNDGSIYFEASMDALDFTLDGTSFTAPQLFENLTEGDYAFRVNSSLDRCGFDTIVTLSSENAFSIDLGPDQELIIGDFVTLDANPSTTDSLTYSWSGIPGLCATCASQEIRLMQSGIVVLRATNTEGCRAESRVLLTGLKDKRVGIPTAISPNNDGVNDKFGIFASPFVEKMGPMRVFDRWGNLLFIGIGEQISRFEGWDGTTNGEPVQEGVYTYILPVVFIDGEERIFQGEVTVIR